MRFLFRNVLEETTELSRNIERKTPLLTYALWTAVTVDHCSAARGPAGSVFSILGSTIEEPFSAKLVSKESYKQLVLFVTILYRDK